MIDLAFLGIVDDFNLILKIFVLMTIISYVFTHLGKSQISIVLIGLMALFILGDYWKLFGGIYLLYMLFVLGVAGVAIDFFFVSGMGGGGEGPSPIDSGKDIRSRQSAIMQRNKGMMGGRPPGR